MDIPEQQLVNAADRMIGDTGQYLAQLGIAIQYCRFNQQPPSPGADSHV
jgi:hypothetical protein